MELSRIGIALLLALSVACSDSIAATNSENSATSSLSTEFEIAVVLSDSISSSADSTFQQASSDFVLVSNGVSASGSEGWLEDVPDSYDTAASSRILYQPTGWVLLEDGAKHEASSSYWARFRAVNSTSVASSRQSVCAMMVEWDEASSTTVAVEVETRLSEACEANDTIALAFTSVVPDAIAEYLEGTRTLNSSLAPLALQNADDLMASPPPSSISSRVFVLLNDELCSKNVSTTVTPQSPVDLLVLNLSAGSSCDETEFSKASSTVPPSTGKGGTSGSSSSSNDSDWTHEWILIVPICCGTFLLGSVFLVYVIRRNTFSPTSEASKDDKEITTNLAYILAM